MPSHLRHEGPDSSALEWVKSPPPRFACGAALRGGEEVLERNVEERAARLGEDVCAPAVADLGVDVDPPAAAAGQPGGQRELVVDRHRAPVADEHARGDRGEAV